MLRALKRALARPRTPRKPARPKRGRPRKRALKPGQAELKGNERLVLFGQNLTVLGFRPWCGRGDMAQGDVGVDNHHGDLARQELHALAQITLLFETPDRALLRPYRLRAGRKHRGLK